MAGKAFSVSQLSTYVMGMFEDELILHNISVYGEITEFTVSGSNTFVTLKEEGSVLRCMRFGICEPFSKGNKAILFGTLKFYAKSGKLTFVFKEIKYYGEGEQHQKLLAVKSKLKAEGLFENRPALPGFIGSAAVITSETGAVIHDFLSVLAKSAGCSVKLIPVSVQGNNAAAQAAEAVRAAQSGGFDALVLARGGGSADDLSAFNDEKLARAVAASRIAVISAIGHETDYSLCDLCAGTRAGTPSIAAKLIADVNRAAIDRMYGLAAALKAGLSRLVAAKQQRVAALTGRIVSAAEIKTIKGLYSLKHAVGGLYGGADGVLKRKFEQTKRTSEKLLSGLSAAEEHSGRRLNELTIRLDGRNPVKILRQGYAKLYRQDKTVASVADVACGEEIKAVLGDGTLTARVLSKQEILKGE